MPLFVDGACAVGVVNSVVYINFWVSWLRVANLVLRAWLPKIITNIYPKKNTARFFQIHRTPPRGANTIIHIFKEIYR